MENILCILYAIDVKNNQTQTNTFYGRTFLLWTMSTNNEKFVACFTMSLVWVLKQIELLDICSKCSNECFNIK